MDLLGIFRFFSIINCSLFITGCYLLNIAIKILLITIIQLIVFNLIVTQSPSNQDLLKDFD